MRPTTLPIVLGLAFLALPGCWMSTLRVSRPLTRTADHVAGSALVVDTVNGIVQIEASDRVHAVTIDALLTCGGATRQEARSRVDAADLSVARDSKGALVIKPAFPGGVRAGDGARITVVLPDADGVTVDTSNGGVTVRGTRGPLVIDTSNGPVSITEHDGPIAIDTSNGPITIANARGTVTADTSNGPITFSLAADQTGPISLDTSNGPIRATVGPAFRGRVTLDTSNGSLVIEDAERRVVQRHGDKDHAELIVGADGPRSVLDTSNGPIVFVVK